MYMLWDIFGLSRSLRERSVTSRALVESALEASVKAAPINAFASIQAESALMQADEADRLLDSGEASHPLCGVPMAIKDNMDQAGVVCAAGSRAYRRRVSDQDAEAVKRLRKAGVVILGRTNMHELADGVTSQSPLHGQVMNPWKAGYHPGGSSGGSAAAVAAGIVPAALGTDTGGSIRIPASLCGVTGLKPSSGLVPTGGVMPLSTTLDHVGPLALRVRDVAMVMSALVEQDQADRFLSACDTLPGRMRIGVLQGFRIEPDLEVARLFEEALFVLEFMSAELEPVRIDRLARATELLSAIYTPEAFAFHEERLKEAPSDFGEPVRRDLSRASRMDPRNRLDAIEEANLLKKEIEDASRRRKVDLFACPTTPHPAGEPGQLRPHTFLHFTSPFNLTGQPAVSLPMGLVDGLPVGLQLVGLHGRDASMLTAAAAFERKLGFDPTPGRIV